MWKLQAPWKKSPPLSQQAPSKNWGPVKPPFLKIWLRFNSPSRKGGGGGGVHTVSHCFLLCLQFCILSHFETIKCTVKSLIAYFINIFLAEIQLKKENLKSVFWAAEFGHSNWYTSLLNHLNMALYKFRLRQWNILSTTHMFKVSKIHTRTMCQIYSKLLLKSPEWHLVLLLFYHFLFLVLLNSNKCWLGLRNGSFRQ